jgi:predicted phage terminase large subunit-like protein
MQTWFESVAYTRLEPGGAIVLIQTRWHQDDLAGWLLREHMDDGWRIVSLPAVAEPGDALGRPEGAALWPSRFSHEALDSIRAMAGSRAWSALYQQRPQPEEGAVFKRAWFQYYDPGLEPEFLGKLVAMDTAFSSKETADYSVALVIGVTETGYYLLDMLRERLEFPALLTQVDMLSWRYRPDAVVVEAAASGLPLVQTMLSSTRWPMKPWRVSGDKVSRAHAASPAVEAGKLKLPTAAPWLRDFVDETTSFPSAPHDDIVDALTLALDYAKSAS